MGATRRNMKRRTTGWPVLGGGAPDKVRRHFTIRCALLLAYRIAGRQLAGEILAKTAKRGIRLTA